MGFGWALMNLGLKGKLKRQESSGGSGMRGKWDKKVKMMLLGLFLGSLIACTQWSESYDEARETAKRCSIQPTAPGCAEAGWGRGGMGF
jgi:hypothetical protein